MCGLVFPELAVMLACDDEQLAVEKVLQEEHAETKWGSSFFELTAF
jgi:hypothetical protein